jgi:hypothetical protein
MHPGGKVPVDGRIHERTLAALELADHSRREALIRESGHLPLPSRHHSVVVDLSDKAAGDAHFCAEPGGSSLPAIMRAARAHESASLLNPSWV